MSKFIMPNTEWILQILSHSLRCGPRNSRALNKPPRRSDQSWSDKRVSCREHATALIVYVQNSKAEGIGLV